MLLPNYINAVYQHNDVQRLVHSESHSPVQELQKQQNNNSWGEENKTAVIRRNQGREQRESCRAEQKQLVMAEAWLWLSQGFLREEPVWDLREKNAQREALLYTLLSGSLQRNLNLIPRLPSRADWEAPLQGDKSMS